MLVGTAGIQPMRQKDQAASSTVIEFHQPQRERSLFYTILVAAAGVIVLLLVGIFITLVDKSMLSIKAFGLSFITGTTWDPLNGIFNGFPYIVGTVVTAVLALFISFPFGMSLAILLGEYYRYGWV